MVKPDKAKPKAKNADQHHRESLIKDLIRAHMKAARDFYFSKEHNGNYGAKYPKFTLEQVTAQIVQRTNEEVSVPTVSRTISNTKDNELKILWDSRNDTNAIMRYRG